MSRRKVSSEFSIATTVSPGLEYVPEPLLVPVIEAARRIGLKPSTVRKLVRRGALAARKVSPTKWLITTASIKAFANKVTA
jgi:excisionase family DNA binding protein